MEKPLPTYDLETMTWEDKRAAAIKMVMNGRTEADIVNVLGYGKAQARKIVKTVNESGTSFYKAPDLYVNDATNEIHYGKGRINLNYTPESLQGEEKNILDKMRMEDVKTQFRDD